MLYRIIIRKQYERTSNYFLQTLWLDLDLNSSEPDIKSKVKYIIMHNDWGTIYDPELDRDGRCRVDVIPFHSLPEWAETKPIKVDVKQYDWIDEYAEEHWKEEYRKCLESPAYFYNTYVELRDKAGNLLPKRNLTDKEIYEALSLYYKSRGAYENLMLHYIPLYIKQFLELSKEDKNELQKL